ncbi:MAG: penicillin-binding protein 2 [Candidatus Omnitrophica bacterium]|nr:penicillin-binding protein 2 [Candidatus Omnitrophota bacterium]
MRFVIFRWFIYAGLAILSLTLFRTQVLQGSDFRRLGEQNRIRLIPLEAARGKVLDRNGLALAENRISYNLVATPEDVTAEVFAHLSRILNLPESEIRKRMSSAREYPFAPAMIQPDIRRETVFQVEEMKPELPGVSIQVSGLRYYPYHEVASHLIGYIGKINGREYEHLDRERFGMNSLLGRSGIEKIYDDALRGWRGGRQIEVDAKGNFVRLMTERKPEPGQDLILTLDLRLQEKVDAMIKGRHASVAVIDLESEGIIALASSPAYDPNVFITPGKSNQRVALLQDKEAPMLDRGTGSAYPPGSIFKLVTAIAALETGKITPNTRLNCTGGVKLGSRVFHCWNHEGHGKLNLYEAIERSCNSYFYRLGSRLSPEDIAHYARELGLGDVLKLEVTDMTAGLVPDSAWKRNRYRESWYSGDTLSLAIGQSYLLTSPVQILRLAAIIAKEGKRVEPRLVTNAPDSRFTDSRDVRVAISEENLKVIKKAMLDVVESDYGTGQFARVDFDKMAAKTGTAQAPPKDPHSWMTGFFPYKNPKIAFVAFVEHGGPGGITAAKLVYDTVKIWHELDASPRVA